MGIGIQRRGREEKDGSMEKKKENELKNKLRYGSGGREVFVETEWVNISLHHGNGF